MRDGLLRVGGPVSTAERAASAPSSRSDDADEHRAPPVLFPHPGLLWVIGHTQIRTSDRGSGGEPSSSQTARRDRLGSVVSHMPGSASMPPKFGRGFLRGYAHPATLSITLPAVSALTVRRPSIARVCREFPLTIVLSGRIFFLVGCCGVRRSRSDGMRIVRRLLVLRSRSEVWNRAAARSGRVTGRCGEIAARRCNYEKRDNALGEKRFRGVWSPWRWWGVAHPVGFTPSRAPPHRQQSPPRSIKPTGRAE